VPIFCKNNYFSRNYGWGYNDANDKNVLKYMPFWCPISEKQHMVIKKLEIMSNNSLSSLEVKLFGSKVINA